MLIIRTLPAFLCVIKQTTYVAVRRMSSSPVSIKFRWGCTASDPEDSPVLFVGQARHLKALKWDDIKIKLEPHVSEKAWQRGLGVVEAAPGEVTELWPRGAALAALPPHASRHAAPSRSHALAKLVRAHARSAHHIVLVARKADLYASAAAIARSFPLYSARSGASVHAAPPPTPSVSAPRTLAVEILLAENNSDGSVDGAPLDPVLAETSLTTAELLSLQDVGEYTRRAARLADMPANLMNVDQFIEEACIVAKELDISPPAVIRGEELKTRGLGGIYGVGAAAASPPALVTLSYCAPGATETVAWVGKGIVYDTGGLSLKARTAMVGMKGDCGGAAAVLAAFGTLVRAKPTVNLHAVLCLAENAVGPNATRPDDVHQLYSGRTVEINNTDAEGRLVLSDGVVYASRDLKANTIVDVATLTGAQGIATGKYHAGIMSNSSTLEALCVRAGLSSGDLAHALPFAPELHFTEFTSTIADMKNSVADRNNAQPSCAGLFILAHLGFDFPGKWLHIDMAAPATCGERATGYGVALLAVLFGAHTQSKLLKALSPAPAI